MDRASVPVMTTVILAVGLAGLLSGCAHLIPTGKVVHEERYLGPPEDPAEPFYDAVTELPVLPFAVWGLHFDEEIVVELADHPSWRMIELVRLELDDQEVWFALTAHRCGRQWVGASQEHQKYGAGFPAPLYETVIDAQRSETEETIGYTGNWELQTGEKIELEAAIRKPLKRFFARNGNAMNHSQETALAIIDLEYLNSAKISLNIDGQAQKLAPLSRGLLIQVAAGVMEASQSLTAGEDGELVRSTNGADPERFTRTDTEDGFALSADLPVATETWSFRQPGEQALLTAATLTNGDRQLMNLRFNPALPDLRHPPQGETHHRMVASLNGRPGYMAGEVVVKPGAEEGTTEILVVPSAPYWAKQRPARSILRFAPDGSVTVETRIENQAVWSFGDVPCPD